MKLLPVDFVPTEDDVICGRGKKCYSHIGNDRFRDRVQGMLALYKQARSKLHKSKVLNQVVEQIRQDSPNGGGFVKQDESGRWFEVGDFLAREKTSQTFRDALHESYKSSSVAKKKRRQDEIHKSTIEAPDQLKINKMARSSIDIAQKIKNMSLEMKNSAKTQVYTQSQTNADILAGIQQASKDMRRDFMEGSSVMPKQQQQQQGFSFNKGDGGNFGQDNRFMTNNMNNPAASFQLEFEPELDLGMATSNNSHDRGRAPPRSSSFGNPRLRRSGSKRGGVSMEMLSNSFPERAASVPNCPQNMLSASFDDMQFRMGQSSSSDLAFRGGGGGEEQSYEDLHHSVPSVQFDHEELVVDETRERLHRSAPNLGFFAPSDLMAAAGATHDEPVVPAMIEFNSSGGVRGQEQFQQQQQQYQIPHQQQQQRSFLDDLPMEMERGIALQLQQQQLQMSFARQQQHLLQSRAPAVSGIVSQLESLAQLRMVDEDDDDNPFEPLPIHNQQQQQQQLMFLDATENGRFPRSGLDQM